MCILKAECTQGGALYRRGYTQEGYSLDGVHSPMCVGTPEKEYSKGGVHSMMCVFVYSKSGVHPRKSKLKMGFTLKIVLHYRRCTPNNENSKGGAHPRMNTLKGAAIHSVRYYTTDGVHRSGSILKALYVH